MFFVIEKRVRTKEDLFGGDDEHAKTIILTQKKDAANAIKINTVMTRKRKSKTKKKINNGIGDVIYATIAINT